MAEAWELALVKRIDEFRVLWTTLSSLEKENLINIIPNFIMNKTYYIGLDLHKN